MALRSCWYSGRLSLSCMSVSTTSTSGENDSASTDTASASLGALTANYPTDTDTLGELADAEDDPTSDLHLGALTLEEIAALGGVVVEMDFTPFFEVAAMLYEGAWVAERLTVVADLMRDHPAALFPVTRRIIGGADNYEVVVHHVKAFDTIPLFNKFLFGRL